jgi:glycosyltransferase involved in cell wall biosynthesis
MAKRVGLFTTFYEAESGYSLVGVCETQIRAFLDHGYDPVVIVREDFKQPEAPTLWSPEMIDLRAVIPSMQLTSGVADDFEERVAGILTVLGENLHDVDVCITHDIILQTTDKECNVAMRRYAQIRPDLLWLHWIHSCPSPGGSQEYPENCRYTPPPGYIVYPNDSDKARVCDTYGLNGQEWRVRVSRTGHAIDPLFVWNYDKLTYDLAEKAGLLRGDVVAVYPARLDRGKQPEKIIRLMGGIKKLGFEPRLLVIDWQSAGKHFQKYIDELLELAERLKVGNRVNFTSRLDDRCSQGVPHHIVIELMDLSNTYFHPSSVETYSLVVHEAALRGKLLVLNYDLPMMRELYGDLAIYMDFGSDRADRTYEPDEQTFWNEQAIRLMSELFQNRALLAQTTARRKWSPQALWREFEPLFYLQPIGE